jgi:predicted O-methyltransferase YrrM
VTFLSRLGKRSRILLGSFMGGWLRYRASKNIDVLISHNHPIISALGRAIQESLDGTLSIEESREIDLIEYRRSQLLKSLDSIAVVDYGAGSGDKKRKANEMRTGVRSLQAVSFLARASKPKFWALILFKVIRETRPVSCLELGTCLGISGSYQASALKFNGEGTISTLEGSEEMVRIARETFSNLGMVNATVISGPFHQTLQDVLSSCKPIDFFFNDGHHDKLAVIDYFQQALPFLSDSAIVVVDDISWSPGMREAWNYIARHEQTRASFNLGGMGIVLIERQPELNETFEIILR